MISWQVIAPFVLQLPALAATQEISEHIWAVFSFTVHGDSTPTLMPQSRTLTSLGARDLYNVGAAFRDHYILGKPSNSSDETGLDTWVLGISQYLLDTEEINIYSTTDQFISASALAFMQGLYPPLQSSNATYLDDTYILADGTVVDSPLDDYQYPRVYTAGLSDPNSISVAGHADCPMYQISELQYQNSPEFKQIDSQTVGFYAYLYDIALSGVLDKSLVGYANAYPIFEYLQYEFAHNSTLRALLSFSDLKYARLLASQYVFATNGNLSVSGFYENDHIRAIAGRTLSRLILRSFETNIETQGFNSKMTLVFGSFEPPVAFAALAQLASPPNRNFYGLPIPGASLAFELYSLDDPSSTDYPNASDLFVRFALRNSTVRSAGFTYYPLFGHGPSHISIPYAEFEFQLAQFLLPSTKGWCNACKSSAIFCDGAVSRKNDPRVLTKRGLSLASAGAIGASVTLVTLAIIAGISWLCGLGIHFRQRSNLGGFKGDDKMTSDHDVSFKKPTADVLGDTITDDNGKNGTAIRGHERVGSWEMRQQHKDGGNAENVSNLDDHEDDVLRVNHYSEPVKTYETV